MAATKSREDPHGPLLQQLCDNLRQRCRVWDGTRLLVALSGGADSVALLRLLAMAAPEHHWQLEVAHFDHGLRPESKDDAAFVQNLAMDLELPFHLGHWGASRRGEDAARQARLAFLEETAQRQRCGAIVLGHHLDDQIETILMRLARGSGPRGLLGMAWRRYAEIDYIRPLLDFPKSRLTAFLVTIGQAWREDPSNQEDHLLRNRVRRRVLPALEESLGPGWREHWAASVEDQRRQWNWLEAQSLALLERARRRRHRARFEGRLETCLLEPLLAAPEPLLRAALQIWLESAGARDLRRAHILEAVRLVQNGQTAQALELPGGIRLHREPHRISIEFSAMAVDRDMPTARVAKEEPDHDGATGAAQRRDPSTGRRQVGSAKVHGARVSSVKTAKPPIYDLEIHPAELPAAARIVEAQKLLRAAGAAEPAEPPVQHPGAAEALVCADHMAEHLTLRVPRPGERMQLLGAPGRRRVARILQDHGIPKRLRPAWPVVADEKGIVWIPAAGIAERCRLGPASKSAVRLRLCPKEPG